MSALDQIVGKNLAFLRSKFGYSQEQIGRFLNVSQPAYHKYETGETVVDREALEKLASLYYVDEFDLMQDKKDALIPSLLFAFRGEADMNAITDFHKIVKNYIMMCDELGKEE